MTIQAFSHEKVSVDLSPRSCSYHQLILRFDLGKNSGSNNSTVSCHGVTG